MKSSYFTKDYLDFFVELKENNNREWFTENKQRFQNSVKLPFDDFVNALIDFFQSKGEHLPVTHKECVFRIYRDIRFSKDKTPYKTRLSAVLAPKGRKEKPLIGMYFEMDDTGIKVYSGMYGPDKNELSKIRYAIAHKSEEFNKLLSSNKFKKTFGEIHGEKNKRLPVEFREAAEIQPLIYNKSFYYFHHLSSEHILSPDLIKSMWNIFSDAKEMTNFFVEALNQD